MNAVAKETDDYENEIVEMGETPYIETLENAKKWRAAKKENNRVKKKPSITLTSRQKEQNRGLLKKPRVLQTKQITLPSGLKPTIRKPTLFEISDIMRGIKHGSKESHSLSPDFKEAFERLLA
jgi:hypothetical protein